MSEYEVIGTRETHHFREQYQVTLHLAIDGPRLTTDLRPRTEVEFEVRKLAFVWTRSGPTEPWSVTVRADGRMIKKDDTAGIREVYRTWVSPDRLVGDEGSDSLITSAPIWVLELLLDHTPEAIETEEILADPSTIAAILEGEQG